MPLLKLVALSLLVSLSVIACSGGSSSSGNDQDQPVASPDTTPPVITLNGESPMEISEGESYVEPGATAEDDVDGSVDVLIEGTVGSQPGDYIIEYSASDSAGNRASIERLVTVVPMAEDGILGLSPESILERMSLRQKAAQLIQAEISYISPEDIRQYGIGSVLNGGGSYPGGLRDASVDEWRQYAERLREASLDTSGGAIGIPVVWGTDAVHGHNNVRGATIYPHNIGLGATRNVALAQEIGAATAEAVAATGIDWIFGPTVAQARDFRWGRSYESYSNDPDLVRDYAFSVIEGIQSLGLAATAKHFIGDGGTERGIDQGNTPVSDADLLAEHGSGYEGAIAADVLSVMATFNSVRGEKVHGSSRLLTDLLRQQLKFEGLLVSDWNGIAQVPDCDNASCPQAFIAGIDMSMTPADWRALLDNIVSEVQRGEIGENRIDEAVLRVLRFKERLGLLSPSYAVGRGVSADVVGSDKNRALARRAVRQSLVLLKNNASTLPLKPSQTIALVGSAADSIPHQAGGWSVTWQGTGTTNNDFPGGTSIRDALESATNLAGGSLHYIPTGDIPDDVSPEAIIVVLAEEPYAEGAGDLPDLNWPSSRSATLARVQSWREQGIPVTTILLSGRPLWINPEINQSDAMVAAWLPGTEAQGIADVILTESDGTTQFDFVGTLPFAWPGGAVNPQNSDLAVAANLFPRGYGLTYQDQTTIEALTEDPRNSESGLVLATEDNHGDSSEDMPEVLWVLRNGEIASQWDRGVGAFDEAINWDVCLNDGGDGCPSIDWRFVSDSLRGQVLEISYPVSAAFAGLFIENLSGFDLSQYDALTFDIAHFEGDNQYAIKLDCFYPCSSGDYLIERIDDGWQTVRVPLDQLEAQGLVLTNVNTGLVIWSTAHDGNRFRIDEVRFIKDSP